MWGSLGKCPNNLSCDVGGLGTILWENRKYQELALRFYFGT